MASVLRCPLCEQVISSKKKYREVMDKMQSEIDKQLAKDRKKHEQEMARKEKAAEQKAARTKVEADKTLREASAKKKEVEAEAQKLEKAQQALRTEKQKLKDREKTLRADLEKKNREKLNRKVEAAREDEKHKHQDELKKASTREDQLKKQVDEMKRKLARKTPDEFGSWQEEELFKLLRAEFPRDDIERIGKGRGGADVIQKVMEGENTLGTIVYESKNVAKWDPKFVDKAKSYRRQYETPHVVIASTAFPPKQREFCVLRSNIIVVSPSKAIHVARVLRQAVVEIGKLELSRDMRPEKVDALYKYVRSQEFKQRLVGLENAYSKLQDLQHEEKKWHDRNWQKQAKQFEDIEKCTREVDAKVAVILEQEVEKRPTKVLRLARGG